MSPFIRTARIAASFLISVLLSGFAAFAQVSPSHLEWEYNDREPKTVSFSAPGSEVVLGFGSGPYRLSYEGSFVYRLDSNGGRTLESIAFDEGRIMKVGNTYAADYHIKDHLGSVRAIVRNGNIIEENDYYPYGAKMAKPGLVSQTSPVSNRYLFSSKEDQAVAFGSYGLDFGARDYAHDGLTWFEPDPLASTYYHLSPYAYCAGNPLKFVDPEGKETYVMENNDGTYNVTGGKLNLNRNIYLRDSNNEFIRDNRGKRISIGKSMTTSSFYNFESKSWSNAKIDLADKSGNAFIKDLTTNLRPLGEYMEGAKSGNIYDFKVTNGVPNESHKDVLRGMPISNGNSFVIASARDIGNLVAGYYAGANGMSWLMSRIAFDIYQRGIEGIQTQSAQYIGWLNGTLLPDVYQLINLFNSIPSLYDFLLKEK